MTTELDIINNVALVVSGAISGAVFSLLIYLILDIIRKRRDRKEITRIIIVDIEVKLTLITALLRVLKIGLEDPSDNSFVGYADAMHKIHHYYDESRYLLLLPRMNVYKLEELQSILSFYDQCKFVSVLTKESIKLKKISLITSRMDEISSLEFKCYKILYLLYRDFTKDKAKAKYYAKLRDEFKNTHDQPETS